VLLIARHGKVAYLKALGARDPQANVAMSEDAIFRIYSMSKMITVAAALTLVEDGLKGEGRFFRHAYEVETAFDAGDIELHAKEILRMRSTINQILSKHTGQPVERIEKDVERDYIMNPEQAKDYGMIDEIIFKHR